MVEVVFFLRRETSFLPFSLSLSKGLSSETGFGKLSPNGLAAYEGI